MSDIKFSIVTRFLSAGTLNMCPTFTKAYIKASGKIKRVLFDDIVLIQEKIILLNVISNKQPCLCGFGSNIVRLIVILLVLNENTQSFDVCFEEKVKQSFITPFEILISF